MRVKKPEFLVYLPHLQSAFRHQLHQLFRLHGWQVDPEVWNKDWGVHIQPAGNGAAALKYLGAYVARTAINDARLLKVTDRCVTFRWKNRDAHRSETLTLDSVEFVRRYLRHVLPRGLCSIRYYGFCHPAAKANRLRVQLHSGRSVQLGAATVLGLTPAVTPLCPRCQRPMRLQATFSYRQRGPPGLAPSALTSLSAWTPPPSISLQWSTRFLLSTGSNSLSETRATGRRTSFHFTTVAATHSQAQLPRLPFSHHIEKLPPSPLPESLPLQHECHRLTALPSFTGLVQPWV